MGRKLYQGQYHNKVDAELSHEARYIWKTAPLVVAIDPAELHHLFTTNKPAAYAQLAVLTPTQRTRQAYAFAAYYNDRNNICNGPDCFEGAEVLAMWEQRIAQFETPLQEV